MAYVNGNYIPFIMKGSGSGGTNVRRVTYYENISEDLIPSEIAQMSAIINSTNSYIIEVDYKGNIYLANHSISNGMIVIWFIDEYNLGFYFIQCSPEHNELVYSYEKWPVLLYKAQLLNNDEQAQARENLNVYSREEIEEFAEQLSQLLEGAVKYNGAQTLSAEQKAQARTNIGAISEETVNQMAANLTVENLGGIKAPTNATEGQFLRYIGGVWKASTVASAEGSAY